jgi:hypothetical protein
MAAGRTDNPDRGYYLYGIAAGEPQLDDVRGVDGTSPVFAIEEQGLAAVVSEVPLSEFGDGVLQQKLEELPWLEEKVRAHEQVLERTAEQTAVLPLRFGTIYRSADPVRDLLAERHEKLASALEQLRGKREWGVKCVVDRDRLLTAVQSAVPGASELAADVESKPAGSAFFARKRLEQRLDEEARGLAARLAAAAHERLAAVADGAVRDAGALLKGAYLVDRAGEDEFRRVLTQTGAEYDRYGLRFELTGPWPPYSFVGSATE